MTTAAPNTLLPSYLRSALTHPIDCMCRACFQLLDIGTEHRFDCPCEVCSRWWDVMGPEPDDDAIETTEMTMEMMQQPKITGYRQLTQEEASLMNEGKALAEEVRLFVEQLRTTDGLDARWISIGQTDLQQGFMALMRAIAQPTTF
jgi:hypothetical protein